MFNVTVLKMKDIIKYLVEIIITISVVVCATRYFSSIKGKIKEDKKDDDEIASPYTKKTKKYNKWVYITIYAVIFLLVLFTIIWSVKQVTINRNVTDTISYGK